LRVLWLAHFSGIDGANLTLAEAVEALNALDHESHVVIPSDGALEARLGGGARVCVCHHNQWISPRRIGVARALRWAAYDHRIAARAIARIAQDTAADVIVSNTTGVAAGALAARRARLPHLWFAHELVLDHPGYRFVLGRRLTMRLMRRWATRVMAVSEAVRRQLAPDLPGVAVSVIPTWVRVPAAEGSEPPPPPAPGPLRLVSVGSWIPAKRQFDAIDAVALLRRKGVDVHLDLVGGCEEWFRPDLERRVREVKVSDHVTLIPFQDDPSPYYLRAHAALMCSLNEGLGRAAIEPLKLARPVIAAAASGLLDVVEDGQNGSLYQPGDPADLARRIAELDRDRELLRVLGERGRRRALATFNRNGMAEGLQRALSDSMAIDDAARPRAV
jgi:glycosyltransferase involved in cell wall biosynthesis